MNTKKTYINILSQNGILTSKAIHLETFQQDLNMNIDLLLNISLEEEKEESLKAMVTIAKLRLYLVEILKLNTDTKLRFIALNELQKELIKNIKLRYIPNRKNCINEELNNISISLLMFETQKSAINIEVNNCYLKLKLVTNKPLPEELEKLTNKYNKLLDTAKLLLNEENINDINNFDNIIIKMAALEKQLEKYVYTHSKNFENIQEELKYLSSIPNKPKEDLWNDIEKLEKEILIFNKYGRHIVTEEDLYQLYEAKFNIYTIDIEKLTDTPFKDTYNEDRNDLEYSIYEQIIMKLIEDILTNKNSIISNKFLSNTTETIKLLTSMFKDENNKYNPDYILSDHLYLTFLIYLHKEDNIMNFFDNYKVPIYFTESIRHKLTEKLPLDTFFRFIRIYLNKGYKFNIELDQLDKNLYKLYINEKDKKDTLVSSMNIYKIPEGIINLSKDQSILKDQPPLIITANNTIDEIILHCQDKNVFTPKSLKYLNTEIFHVINSNSLKMETLYLNDGLTSLKGPKKIYDWQGILDLDTCIRAKEIFLPPTLEYISENAINYLYLEKIHFVNFNESKILNDREKLKNYFFDIYRQKLRPKFGVETFLSLELEFQPFLKSIILHDTNNNEYNIELTVLEKFIEKKTYYEDFYTKIKIYSPEVFSGMITDEFISLVKGRTNYELGSQTNKEITENKLILRKK